MILIEISKVPQYIILRPLDKEGGHDISKIMGDRRIREQNMRIESDKCLMKDEVLFILNDIVKENKIKCVTDESFKKFAASIKHDSRTGNQKLLLTVGVLRTKITGSNIPVKEIQNVTRFFLKAAVNTPKYKSGQWDGYINLYSKRDRSFPTGLLAAVTKVLEKKKLQYESIVNYEEKPKRQYDWSVDWDKITPDIDQVEAIDAAVKYGRGIVKAPTGWGKTAVFAKGLIASLGVPTLFIANKKQLLDDAASDFTEGIRGAKCLAIKDGMFGTVKMTSSVTRAQLEKAIDAPIIVATIQSLDARLKDKKTRPILEHWLHNVCKLVIVDESQAVGTRTWDDVLDEVKAPYRIFLSATPRRTDGASIKLIAGSGPCIFSTTAEEQIAKGRLCELDITYNTFDHKLFNERDANISYNEAYRSCVLENEKRNQEMIINPTIDMIKEGRHVLILIQYIEHGHILKQMLINSGVSPDNIRFVWGDTPKAIRHSAISEFRKGDFQVMIGSTIFDAGVNIPVISGVVLGGAGNSDITLIQRIGRGARNADYEELIGYLPEFMKDGDGQKVTKVYDVMDANVKFFAKQSRHRYQNACDEFGKDRVHIKGTSERPPSKMSRESIDGMAAAAAKFKMMMGDMQK